MSTLTDDICDVTLMRSRDGDHWKAFMGESLVGEGSSREEALDDLQNTAEDELRQAFALAPEDADLSEGYLDEEPDNA